MKQLITYALIGAFAAASVNCTTTYDAYGNPRQTVTPEGAVAGAAAAGVLGYALSKNKKKDRRYSDSRYGDRRYGYYDRYGNWRWY